MRISNTHRVMKMLALCILMLMPLTSQAQTANVKIGYLSYEQALRTMPEYAIAQKTLESLTAKYDAEAMRVKNEFNQKYEEFLEGQNDFPKTILQKRQTELQELLEKNIAFKEESRRLLKAAEKDILAPLKEKLAGILSNIAKEKGLAVIVNTDGNACPFIDPQLSEDINQAVADALK